MSTLNTTHPDVSREIGGIPVLVIPEIPELTTGLAGALSHLANVHNNLGLTLQSNVLPVDVPLLHSMQLKTLLIHAFKQPVALWRRYVEEAGVTLTPDMIVAAAQREVGHPIRRGESAVPNRLDVLERPITILTHALTGASDQSHPIRKISAHRGIFVESIRDSISQAASALVKTLDTWRETGLTSELPLSHTTALLKRLATDAAEGVRVPLMQIEDTDISPRGRSNVPGRRIRGAAWAPFLAG